MSSLDLQNFQVFTIATFFPHSTMSIVGKNKAIPTIKGLSDKNARGMGLCPVVSLSRLDLGPGDKTGCGS